MYGSPGGYSGPGVLPLPGEMAFSRMAPGALVRQSQPGDRSYAWYQPAGTYGDFGASSTPKSRVARGEGGYIYRQFSDGTIAIEASLKAAEVGKMITQTTHPKAWSAITVEIGTWQEYKKGQVSDILKAVAPSATSALTAALTPQKKGKRKKQLPAPLEMPESSSAPGWLIPVLAGGAALLVIFLLLNKDSKDEKK